MHMILDCFLGGGFGIDGLVTRTGYIVGNLGYGEVLIQSEW